MSARLAIPTYSGKDFIILFLTMLPLGVLINYWMYGSFYFNHPGAFLSISIITFIFLALAFIFYGLVAISLRNHLPGDKQIFKRLLLAIIVFGLMSAVTVTFLLKSYEYFNFWNFQYSDTVFVKAYITIVIINIFLTFLIEGIYQFEKYQSTARETELLKKEYMQSQLLGLKSQMNPHFLFNSLNTLSCLIHDDEERAEEFLDHMSKVYRYLLKNTDEKLVPLQTELQFFHSYTFLLKERHGGGLKVVVDISEHENELLIPPFTLQNILDDVLNKNTISKNTPLSIELNVHDCCLTISHTNQQRINKPDSDEVLQNINNKCRLLCQKEVVVDMNDFSRAVIIPLLPSTKYEYESLA
jgi:two-component system, LytTR family, sensor kinase